MIKYPRTYHLPFSQEIHSDDKTHINPEFFINKPIIITEKLDGGNCCLNDGKVYARSVNSETNCPSFNYIKNKHAWKTLECKDIFYYGENMFAKHSIKYTKLTDYFYIFAILKDDMWLPWELVKELSYEKQWKTVPVLYEGKFNTIKQLQEWMDKYISYPGTYSNETEGFVIRISDSFSFNEFSLNVAKYVRKGHVQTDKHWSKNWIQNLLMDG
ncbi:hypothetical protein M0R19_08135 [Candidatus Pacearchaeota archaeon]|nr:hypothetical protein [Candidatus Pacearchaeota archaeon]